jgi:hypothetical protein
MPNAYADTHCQVCFPTTDPLPLARRCSSLLTRPRSSLMTRVLPSMRIQPTWRCRDRAAGVLTGDPPRTWVQPAARCVEPQRISDLDDLRSVRPAHQREWSVQGSRRSARKLVDGGSPRAWRQIGVWRLGVWHEVHRLRERRSRAAFAVTRPGRSARHWYAGGERISMRTHGPALSCSLGDQRATSVCNAYSSWTTIPA